MKEKLYQKILGLWKEGLPSLKTTALIIEMSNSPMDAAEMITRFFYEKKTPSKPVIVGPIPDDRQITVEPSPPPYTGEDPDESA